MFGLFVHVLVSHDCYQLIDNNVLNMHICIHFLISFLNSDITSKLQKKNPADKKVIHPVLLNRRGLTSYAFLFTTLQMCQWSNNSNVSLISCSFNLDFCFCHVLHYMYHRLYCVLHFSDHKIKT
jgi:hypothetical protein